MALLNRALGAFGGTSGLAERVGTTDGAIYVWRSRKKLPPRTRRLIERDLYPNGAPPPDLIILTATDYHTLTTHLARAEEALATLRRALVQMRRPGRSRRAPRTRPTVRP